MKLNDLHYSKGTRSNTKRLGRGPGSGLGKTAGRGHKGQHARSGGYHKVGFEGGQMPLQRRIPKRGFRSSGSGTAEVRLDSLAKVDGEVTLDTLKVAGLVSRKSSAAKIIASGQLATSVTIRGLAVTEGARRAIEAAGGTIAE